LYRLLVVDDEPYTVEGLYDLFQDAEAHGMELEVYKAFSAFEALEWLDKIRIDIVLSDVEMPEMSGLELQRRIAERWPRCKVVFLSGHDDFQYAQTSLRYGAVDYVLKTEDDGVIVEAVRKAYALLREELNLGRMLEKARRDIVRALPALQKEYLLELLRGDRQSAQSRKRRFAELGISLDAERAVLLMRARVDRWPESFQSSDKSLMLFAVHNIVDEYLSSRKSAIQMLQERDGLLWLLQPAEDGAWPDFARFLFGTLETIQASCKKYLHLSVSFAASESPCAWDELPERFDRLNFLFLRGLGMGEELLISDRHAGGPEDGSGPVRSWKRNVELLEHYLERGMEAEFQALLAETLDEAEAQASVRSAAALELFFALGSMFLSYLNRSGMMDEVAREEPLGRLFPVDVHASWDEMKAAFQRLARLCLKKTREERVERSNEFIRRIHEYIDNHLDRDLSLAALADIVHLNPSYLSRLHRETTRQAITAYIAEKRLAKAKQLLTETNLKIHEVGARIGYESPPYFTRFFRKMTGMTPQEYRDAHSRY